MYQAAIFDLDGTVVDTVESIGHTMNLCLAGYGLPEQPIEKYRFFAGDGAQKLVERALEAAGNQDASLAERAFKDYMERFRSGCLYHVRAFSGLKETLTKMKKSGMRLAVCTNKPHWNAVEVIRKVYGENLFDEILGDRPDHARKPSPQGPLLLAGRLNAEPKSCLYVGDTDTDMRTGRAAGMVTAGVLWGFRGKEELLREGASVLAERPEDLLAIAGIGES